MSKSNWQDLPDWTSPDSYGFVADASNAEWAWEFLRRNESYSTDWHQRDVLRKEYLYSPPMDADESEQDWMRRIAYKTDTDPIKQRKDIAIANKWWLESLHDPAQPFTHAIQFIMPGWDFPRFITEPQDFDTFFEVAELDGMDFQRVSAEYAVVAVDMVRPLTAQFKVMEKVLRNNQRQLVKAGLIPEAERTAGQARTWLRHLRVLDALRAGAKYREIALVLGSKQSEGATTYQLRDQGEGFVTAARTIARTGYRAILTYKGTP